ncbi:hypothetical protein [Phyllobacterium myrsinacearum]|uniref:Uncharacterized protein n=1 Tax=Phyllobacterium myrsinacearum TaxID=28101 RepID=A0A839EU52_9HYPH|nr:hypothetical protein [Phyllobacterium myrsinacearum]MBA8881635.1 hypothetical protein [Phyllobacterium myrsinacearum]
MAFASRNESGTWRLCLRMGKTITHINAAQLPGVEIGFSSQATAKKCADALNERFWKEYDRHERLATGQPSPLENDIIELIHQMGGISKADYERLQ